MKILEGGANKHAVDDALSKYSIAQAESIWPQLKISSWSDHPRSVEYVAKCEVSGKLLVHITTDWKDCFLVLVMSPDELKAEGYILFDIGAEYQQIRLVCPTLGLDQVAEEGMIRSTVFRLPGKRDPFAILEANERNYIQAYWMEDDGLFDVEHQLVSIASHYDLETRVSAEVVVNLFLSYALGYKEWACEHTWKKMDI